MQRPVFETAVCICVHERKWQTHIWDVSIHTGEAARYKWEKNKQMN